MSDTGLLFVYGECGPNVSPEEFSDWYIDEHGPLRLTVRGFNTANLYKASDERIPTWLALYDLETPAVATSESYKALASKASARDKALVPRLQDLNRSIFQLLTTTTGPIASSSFAYPAQHILIVSMLVDTSLADEFNKWYDEEHVHQFLQIPGFIRVRRYKLLSNVQLVGQRETDEPVHNYLALFDVERDDFSRLPEFKATTKTPWALKILNQVTSINIRRFTLHKSLPKTK